MSDDYNVICHTCRVYKHFGQRMGIDNYSIGHGGDDSDSKIKKEKQEVIEFCMRHAWCNPLLGVQIIVADPFMDTAHAEYVRVDKG